MYTTQQIAQYLDRIHLEGPLPQNADTLTRIIRAHYLNVPYENLDVLRGVPVELTEAALFDKIVRRHRGGYCFELNAALGALLTALGFQVENLSARFILGEPEGIVPMRRHQVLLVTLPEVRYLVDAGIMRESCRIALPLEVASVRGDGVAFYTLKEDSFYGYILCQAFLDSETLRPEPFRPMFGFTMETQVPEDFVMPSFFCEKHPDSPFNKSRMVGIRTADGSYNLIGNTFKTLVGSKVTQQRELDDKDVPGVLERVFGLKMEA